MIVVRIYILFENRTIFNFIPKKKNVHCDDRFRKGFRVFVFLYLVYSEKVSVRLFSIACLFSSTVCLFSSIACLFRKGCSVHRLKNTSLCNLQPMNFQRRNECQSKPTWNFYTQTNLFKIFINQTAIRLYLPFSD